MVRQENAEDFRALFEFAPISMWEEDFSGIKRLLDNLRAREIKSLEAYIRTHPEFVDECVRQIVVLRVNRETLRLFKARSQEELLQNLSKVLRDEMHRHFENELLALWEEKESWSGEMINYTLTGEPVHVHMHLRILPEARESWNRVLIMLEDITSRVDLENQIVQRTRQLQETQRFSEVVFELSPVAIVVTDAEDKIISWNPEAQRLFGYTPEEARGHHIDDLVVPPEYRSEAQQLSDRVRYGSSRLFTRRARKDGTLVDVEVAVMPVVVNGEYMAGVAIYHDITDLQQARRLAEQATQAKSAFLASMSHEIRTPMNGVIGMTSLLLNTPLNQEQREFVETIRRSGETLLTIINDILDFSKIEAGRMELEQLPFNLRECVESALDLLAPRAAEKGIELGYLMENDVPEAIYGDVTRLRQILVNLLSNAVKFTEKGEVMVSVGLEKTNQDTAGTSVLHFRVRDTGIGISPEKIPDLFQPFTQVDASTTRKYGGTGLGLTICKKLTGMMGGNIWVETEGIAGRGSTFHFTIQTQSSPDLPSMLPALYQHRLENKRVLIVDDNSTNCEILSHMAQSWHMLPLALTSARAALSLIEQGQHFDVAILDVQMPEMDGLTPAGELRKRLNNTRLPIIILTSLGRRDELPADVEVAAYLYKPIKMSQLYDALVATFSEKPIYVSAQPAAISSIDPQMGIRHPLRILLAEDHDVNQKVALMLLDRLGYRADIAANGLEALEALRRQEYDLVLMDIHMPEMDGVEATRHIRNRMPPDLQPYIVALTANALEGDRETYLKAGMNDYLSKPLRVEQLVQVLARCPTRIPVMDTAPAQIQTPLQEAQPAAPPTEEKTAELAVNLTTLGEYFPDWQSDPTALAELAQMFFEDSEKRLPQITTWLQARESERARKGAHTIKGASLTFGAETLAALCKQLEDDLRAENWLQAEERLHQLQLEYQRVKQSLLKLIGAR